MSQLFASQPFTARDFQYFLGTYAQQAVKIHSGDDVAIARAYAPQKNTHVVIRNTGHDYNGESTGAGTIAIWTHNPKSTMVFDYETPR